MASLIHGEGFYFIPYAPDLSRGCHPHVDLRITPEKIDEIQELKAEPLLKQLVAVLNDQRGRFMTHSCAVGPSAPSSEGSIPSESMGASCWKSCYVSISCISFDQNTDKTYNVLYLDYRPRKMPVCFELVPAHFCTPEEQKREQVNRDTNGFMCLLWAIGWGKSGAEAETSWTASVNDLIEFFTGELGVGITETGGQTVSQYLLNGPE
jgi:hypothetical protein